VNARAAWLEDGLYVVFFSQDGSRAIGFDLGNIRRSREMAVQNVGLGRRLANQNWSLVSTNEDGIAVELNGGAWTLEQMVKAIEVASTNPAVVSFAGRE